MDKANRDVLLNKKSTNVRIYAGWKGCSRLFSLTEAIRGLTRVVAIWRQRSRARSQLSRIEDRSLRDFGLSPAQVAFEMAQDPRREFSPIFTDNRYWLSGRLQRERGLAVPFLIRGMTRADARHIAEVFDAMSPASRYHRFLTNKTRLSLEELSHLTSVDNRNHKAWIAFMELDSGREIPIGISRYIRDGDDAVRAEIAIAVADAHHRKGVGSELLRRMGEAAAVDGIVNFHGRVHADNIPMLRWLRRLHAAEGRVEEGAFDFSLPVACVIKERQGAA